MFVVPTSISLAPLCSMISGTRKEPPISTSSPLETITSLSFARAERQSMVAAALLLTTMAASAPVILVRIFSTWSWRDPLDPRFTSYSRLV